MKRLYLSLIFVNFGVAVIDGASEQYGWAAANLVCAIISVFLAMY
jgi:putative effector of murein hydrolase LrgA (UPF0299 family)